MKKGLILLATFLGIKSFAYEAAIDSSNLSTGQKQLLAENIRLRNIIAKTFYEPTELNPAEEELIEDILLKAKVEQMRKSSECEIAR